MLVMCGDLHHHGALAGEPQVLADSVPAAELQARQEAVDFGAGALKGKLLNRREVEPKPTGRTRLD